jgi:hypothetical protein
MQGRIRIPQLNTFHQFPVCWTSQYTIAFEPKYSTPYKAFEWEDGDDFDDYEAVVTALGLHHNVSRTPETPKFPKNWFFPGSRTNLPKDTARNYRFVNIFDYEELQEYRADLKSLPYYHWARRTAVAASPRIRSHSRRFASRLERPNGQLFRTNKVNSRKIKKLLNNLIKCPSVHSVSLDERLRIQNSPVELSRAPKDKDPLEFLGQTQLDVIQPPPYRRRHIVQSSAWFEEREGLPTEGHWIQESATILRKRSLKRLFLVHPSWIGTPKSFKISLGYEAIDLIWQNYYELTHSEGVNPKTNPVSLANTCIYLLALTYIKAWFKSREASDDLLRPDWYHFAYVVLPQLEIVKGHPIPQGLASLIRAPKESKNIELSRANPQLLDQAGFREILHFY